MKKHTETDTRLRAVDNDVFIGFALLCVSANELSSPQSPELGSYACCGSECLHLAVYGFSRVQCPLLENIESQLQSLK